MSPSKLLRQRDKMHQHWPTQGGIVGHSVDSEMEYRYPWGFEI